MSEIAKSNPVLIAPVVSRYKDAYRVASALIELGASIKIGALVVGTPALLVAFVLDVGLFKLFLVFAIAAAVAFVWSCGVVVAAQGQLLIATLDTSVASSPFLSNVERADAMGLARSMADREARSSVA